MAVINALGLRLSQTICNTRGKFHVKMGKRKMVQKTLESALVGKSKKGKTETDDENAESGKNRTPAKKPKLSDAKASKTQENEKPTNSKGNVKPMNRTDTDYSCINFECDKTSPEGKCWNFKISSWNIVSLKSLTNKNGMEFLERECPDIMCFQETKCSEKKVPENAKVSGYHRYFLSGKNEGYAGVALYSKQKPIKVEYGIRHDEFDSEGRVITAEYDKFFLVTAYVPNAGRGLVTLPKRMKWDPIFRDYIKKLDKIKPIILCGDMNVAHKPIDLKNPTTNLKTAGFTQEERDGFTALLNEGFVDTFRHLYPDTTGAYTYWNYIGNARSRNTGWRLDYFIVSERILNMVCNNVIRNEVYGSDHCPITLFVGL